MAALTTHNPMLATKFLAQKEELKETKRNLHLRHIRELRANIPNSMASSGIYLDLLDAMTAILSLILNMAYVLEEANRSSTRSRLVHGTGQFTPQKVSTTRQLYASAQVDVPPANEA